jgi:hypothetical protein
MFMNITIEDIEDVRDGMRPFADLPWVGRDCDGRFAIFESTGFGQIPMEIFASVPLYLQTLDTVFLATSEGGTFVYEYDGPAWLDRTRAYVRIASPKDDAPNVDFLMAVPHVRFPELRFGDTREIIIDRYFTDTNA